jgi:arylsulfatase
MQVYAAMIDRVDQNIGRLLKKIEELGEEENTLIMFASDNGASAKNIETGSGEIGSLTRWASLQEDWANVSNTPLRYYKTDSYEGGICTPFIVFWPGVIKYPGRIYHQPFHFIDVMSTLQDITGAPYPTSADGQLLTPMQGISILPVLKGKEIPERSKPIFWEFKNGAAIRDGKWKLVTNSFDRNNRNNTEWELYDIIMDRTEINNLAQKHPEVVEKLNILWQKWYTESYGN